jgi:Ni,Fe-hydrogenase III large subunit/Ni,Fe-hydrogenase III component G
MSGQTLEILKTSPVLLAPMPTQAANEVLVKCDRADLARAGAFLDSRGASLATMVGLDLTPLGEEYAVEYVYSLPGFDEFLRLRADIPRDDPEYPSVTPLLPAAQWYEREAKDLLGLIPVGHPDPRRLILHDAWPRGYHPLRKEISAIEPPPVANRRFDYFEVQGEGIYELPVGPIHAGIIEPGHFRFSNAGELILHLDARLFYTHRGVEKIAEGKSFEEALFTVERTCGACTVSHAVSFCSAVERMAHAELSQTAIWLRTLLLELERLYNHVGDIGNICAGAGFHMGSSQGAILKERLQRLNEALTGHRFLMGVVGLGGLRYDLDPGALVAGAKTLAEIRGDFEAYMDAVLSSRSFVSRITGPGHVSTDTALAMGATGVAARASGVSTDFRSEHPHLAYPQLQPHTRVEEAGDVGARLMVRASEVLDSFDMAVQIIGALPPGSAVAAIPPAPAGASALGYSESPRGSNVHWLMTDGESRVYRLRIRSASFANWPVVTRAVVENMVPDFPLINKSFELCYACCDR